MKCHYEVLEVSRTATDDEIRKSYRKLALRWHPDKNPDRQAEAKEVFQLVQQAYEVLSDPQERAWYDKHRETILLGRGSDYKDDSLDVYEYFTTSCFSGYGDDARGFYAVYAEVFKKIAAEDSEFDKNLDSDFEIPVFGDSKSDYDNVVHPFYAYWQSYSTKKTYSWLDEYDVRQAPNRRILRLMEKENKKIRDKARKERNEEVRALVAFVRKRDKRVVEHIKKMEQEAVEKEKKSQEMRRQQILKRQNEMKSYVENDWAKFSNLESELKDIEAGLAAEFQDGASDNESSDEEDLYNNLFCVACSKVFKTPKAFANHENSKKHRENVEALRLEMQEEEEEPPESDTEGDSWKEEYKRNLSANENGDTLDSVLTEGMSLKSSGSSILEDSEVEVVKPKKKEKRKQKKRLMVIPDSDLSDDSIHRDFNPITENLPPIKEKAKKMAKDLETKLSEKEASGTDSEPAISIESNRIESTDFVETDRNGRVIGAGNMNKKKKKKVSRTKGRQEATEAKPTGSSVAEGDAPDETKAVHRCEVCNTEFKSKNSLFKHLNTTGHAVPVPKSTDTPRAKPRKSKK